MVIFKMHAASTSSHSSIPTQRRALGGWMAKQASKLSVLYFTATILFGAGCESTQQASPRGNQPLPPYAKLAEAHNANAALLQQMWSRCTIAMRWTDEDGHLNHQQAEGLFIFRGERDIALKISKIDAVNLFWFGSNSEKYWLIDLYNDPKTTYVGSHTNPRQALPIKLPVSSMLQLVAVRPIAETGAVSEENGLIVLSPTDQPIRLYLDPEHQMPVKTEVLDKHGFVEATCFMHSFERLDVEGVSSLADPFVATRFVVTTPADSGSMTLVLDDMQTSKVSDIQFDLERLKKAFPTERMIDLDVAE